MAIEKQESGDGNDLRSLKLEGSFSQASSKLHWSRKTHSTFLRGTMLKNKILSLGAQDLKLPSDESRDRSEGGRMNHMIKVSCVNLTASFCVLERMDL